jgi:DNA-binding NarL/FixJ family response regulator
VGVIFRSPRICDAEATTTEAASSAALIADQAQFRLRAGVVAQNEIRRQRVASILTDAGLVVLGDFSRPEELVRGRASDPLHAVVLAWDRLERAAVESVRFMRETLHDTRVVGVASAVNRRLVRDALGAGLDGLVMERDLDRSLVLAVQSVCAGQLSLPPDYRGQIARPALSAREKQILGMVVMGFTNSEIARKLYIAESTVKSHLSSAFARLGVRSRNEATALILDPEEGLGTGILAI